MVVLTPDGAVFFVCFYFLFFFFQAEDGIRDPLVTGVQTCALPISARNGGSRDPQWSRLRGGRPGPPARRALGWLADARCPRAPAPVEALAPAPRRADEPSGSRVAGLAGVVPRLVRGQRGGRVSRSLLPEPDGLVDRRPRAGRHYAVSG